MTIRQLEVAVAVSGIFFLSAPEENDGELATGKYGCTEVRVHPAECGEQLGTDPSKIGSSKSLVLKSFLGREHFGTLPCQSPSRFGIRLHFLRPHFPSPKRSIEKSGFVPESRHASNQRTSRTGKGKPGAKLGSTLPLTVPHLL